MGGSKSGDGEIACYRMYFTVIDERLDARSAVVRLPLALYSTRTHWIALYIYVGSAKQHTPSRFAANLVVVRAEFSGGTGAQRADLANDTQMGPAN